VSEVIFEHVIEPGTGKAVEVRAGQILRIEQVEGANVSTSTASISTTTRNSCIAAGPARCTAFTRPKARSFGPGRRASTQ
jgi:hypothetical protein